MFSVTPLGGSMGGGSLTLLDGEQRSCLDTSQPRRTRAFPPGARQRGRVQSRAHQMPWGHMECRARPLTVPGVRRWRPGPDLKEGRAFSRGGEGRRRRAEAGGSAGPCMIQ